MLVSLCEWMLGEGMLGELSLVNGESSAILLLLNFYANSSSTLSVISYQLSIYHPSFISHPSPPQPAGLRNCNAAAFDPF